MKSGMSGQDHIVGKGQSSAGCVLYQHPIYSDWADDRPGSFNSLFSRNRKCLRESAAIEQRSIIDGNAYAVVYGAGMSERQHALANDGPSSITILSRHHQ